MTAVERAAHIVSARLTPTAAVDPNLLPLIEQAIAFLVDAIRECYTNADSAFAYLTRDFGLLQWWRETIRDRRVNEAINEAVDRHSVALNCVAYGSSLRPDELKRALRAAIRDDLSRGLLADLYER